MILLPLVLFSGCWPTENASLGGRGIAQLQPVYSTPRDVHDNIDSAAIWHGPDDQHWLLTTAKNSNTIIVYDAVTGEVIRRFGETGVELGHFVQPNGIVVIDNFVLVVERNNHRVQVLSLPDLRPLGEFGSTVLKQPYGISAYPSDSAIQVFVTDNYETPDEQTPPDSLLDERVHRFQLITFEDHIVAEHLGGFGATTGSGVLRVVESIYADPLTERVLIAEEQKPHSQIKVYNLEGEFTGTVIDDGFYQNQAEGITLFECPDGTGYWITTDQHVERNTFHLFDREDLSHLGSFRIEGARSVDGIALTQRSYGPFEHGAFFAVSDNGNVEGVSWSQIAESLSIKMNCTE